MSRQVHSSHPVEHQIYGDKNVHFQEARFVHSGESVQGCLYTEISELYSIGVVLLTLSQQEYRYTASSFPVTMN